MAVYSWRGTMWLRKAADTPDRAELADLVLHQRDQRRDHDGQAVEQERGQLVAERLAAAGRHHDQRVLTLQDAGDDLGLEREELREAEGLLQHLAGALPERGRRSGAFQRRPDAARRRWRRRPRQRLPGAGCGFKEPAGQLDVTAQFLLRPFLGPPPVRERNAQQRAGGNLGDRLLKTDEGQRAPAVAGGVAIADALALAVQLERLVRPPEHRAAVRQPGALGDVERA